MIYLHKILPLIFSPLIITCLLIIIGTILNSKKISITGIFLLFFCSLPIVSNKLIDYLEKGYELKNIDKLDNADAIIVLSGMIRTLKTKDGYKYEFKEGVDRFIAGINLIKNNKAPLLVFTSGKVPWSSGISEGEYLKEMAIKFGVSEDKILITKKVENTEQEAKAIKELFPNKDTKFILITSAFHMKRALHIFNTQNIKVIAFPVDFRRKYQKFIVQDIIPSAGSFAATSNFVREIIGRLYYKLIY